MKKPSSVAVKSSTYRSPTSGLDESKRKNARQIKKACFSAFVGLFVFLSPIAHAQFMEKLFSRKIPVQIKHPPNLSINTERIVISLKPSANCSSSGNQLHSKVTEDFIRSGIEVLDRESLQQILNEHQLARSGITDEASSATAGELTGASMMLNLAINSCDTEQEHSYDNVKRYDSETKEYYWDVEYYSKTSFLLRASIKATNLKTGSVVAARSLGYKPDETYESFEGYPVFPAADRLQRQAINSAVGELHRMFLPWTETQNLVLYKTRKCDLDRTYNAVQAGALASALKYAEESISICNAGTQLSGRARIKPKTLSQAYYNFGMVQMIFGEYETAIQTLRKAQGIRRGDLVDQAIGATQKAWQSRLSFKAIEDIEQAKVSAEIAARNKKMEDAVETESTAAETEGTAAEAERERESKLLNNAQVISLIKQGMSEVIVLQLIKSAKETRLDISPAGLIALSGAGVNDKIMQAIIQKASAQ